MPKSNGEGDPPEICPLPPTSAGKRQDMKPVRVGS